MENLTLGDFFLGWFVYTMSCVIVIMIAVLDIPSEPFGLDPHSKHYKVLSKIGIGLLFLTIPGVPTAIVLGIRALVKKYFL